jgi:hypothetical protein
MTIEDRSENVFELGREVIRPAFEKLHQEHGLSGLEIIASALAEVHDGAVEVHEDMLSRLLKLCLGFVVFRLDGAEPDEARRELVRLVDELGEALPEQNAPSTGRVQ